MRVWWNVLSREKSIKFQIIFYKVYCLSTLALAAKRKVCNSKRLTMEIQRKRKKKRRDKKESLLFWIDKGLPRNQLIVELDEE